MESKIQNDLKAIYEFAIQGNSHEVRLLLDNGLGLVLSRLFVEGFYMDYEASLFIKKQATCIKCTRPSTKYFPEPICCMCSFENAMQCIEYGSSI